MMEGENELKFDEKDFYSETLPFDPELYSNERLKIYGMIQGTVMWVAFLVFAYLMARLFVS